MTWLWAVCTVLILYQSWVGLWSLETVRNVARWSVRNRWRCWAWWLGLSWIVAVVCWSSWYLIALRAPSSVLALVGIFSWPLGAALGGLIDAVLRSRRSKSRAVAVRR